MANNKVILLVHGMGTHKKGAITAEYKKALKDRSTSFGVANSDYLKKADYKEFNYSGYLDLVRNQFAENAEARKKGFKFLSGTGFEEKLVTQLTNFESNFGKDEFLYTHFLDVILYGTMYFGEKIRLDFVKQFELLRKKYGHKNIHIVCHSLGSAVVHDAMAKFYRTDSSPFDDIPDLQTGNFNIASLWTFANVSRMVNLLNGLTDPNHSTVVTGSNGCTNTFVNIRHKYDPFTWFKTYKRQMQHSATLINTTIRKVNTHDFYEYITEPKVSKALLSFIYRIQIDDAAYEKGVDEYKENIITTEVKDLKQKIDTVRNSPSVDSITKAVKKFKEIQKLIK